MLDSDTLDSHDEEECSAHNGIYEAYLGYKEARDTLNQVRRGRGFWPEIAIPAPDGRSATLAVRNNDETFRGKGKDRKGTTHKGKSKGRTSGKSGKSKSNGKGDPLKQRLVNVHCVLFTPPFDCQEIKFPASEIKNHSLWDDF